MKLAKARVVLTGASRGLGAVLAEAFAARGAELLLVARSAQALEAVGASAEKRGARVHTLACDVGKPDSLERLVSHAARVMGGIDVLVNNAGIERAGFYEDLTAEAVEEVITVNLTVPMQLTRMVLPEMLSRNRGHVLNVASIAGLAPFAFGETYGATKHGLVGFTRALRASLKERRTRVSASVLCPGFVSDTGMYQEARDRYGVATDRLIGTCTSQEVAEAAIGAIERDQPEVVVNSTPVRHAAALSVAWPAAAERVSRLLKLNDTAHRLAERRRAEQKQNGAEQKPNGAEQKPNGAEQKQNGAEQVRTDDSKPPRRSGRRARA